MSYLLPNNKILNAEWPAQSFSETSLLLSTFLMFVYGKKCAISDDWPVNTSWITEYPEAIKDFDFVVIGAGTAGSIVSSRLSENRNWKILVLEAGDETPPLESEVPALFWAAQHTNATWNYWTEPSNKSNLAYIGRSCYWPRGKTIGGSGSIDPPLYVRGDREDYNRWMAEGNPSWGWDEVLPYFEKSLHPTEDGPQPQLFVQLNSSEFVDANVQEMLLSGARELGIPRVSRFYEGNRTGYGNVPGLIKDGKRASAGKVYLRKAALRPNMYVRQGKVFAGPGTARPNLFVFDKAQVTRINFDASGKRVQSLNFSLPNQEESLQFTLKKELILSAGTINSATLLLQSGVGPAQHLSQLGIPVVHNLSVGHNLRDQVAVPVFYKFDNSASSRPLTQADILDDFFQYINGKKGPLASHSRFSLVGLINTSENSTESSSPDIGYYHYLIRRGDRDTLLSWTTAVALQDRYVGYLWQALQASDLLLVYTVLLHPESVGHVTLRSADATQLPRITANYLEEPADVETLLRGIAYLEKLEATRAFRARRAQILHLGSEECDRQVFKSPRYWRCYIKYFSNTLYQPTSTLKMGPEGQRNAVVDQRLRLHGVENLRVVGSSVMPDIPSINKRAASVMLAEKATDIIKADYHWKYVKTVQAKKRYSRRRG